MPDWLDLPTLKQVNDRMLVQMDAADIAHPNLYGATPAELRKKILLYHAARNRKRSRKT